MNNRIVQLGSHAAGLIVTHRTRRPGRRNVCSFARLLSTGLLFGALADNVRANLVYVDANAPVGGDGTSWAAAANVRR